jgi:hypothetical protein
VLAAYVMWLYICTCQVLIAARPHGKETAGGEIFPRNVCLRLIETYL